MDTTPRQFPIFGLIHLFFLVYRSAREAIRWLERELGRGHKGIRAQERGEAASLPWPPPARREDGRTRYQVHLHNS